MKHRARFFFIGFGRLRFGSLAEMRPGMSFQTTRCVCVCVCACVCVCLHGRQEPDAPGRQGPRDRGGEDEPRAGLRTANEAQGEVLFYWLLLRFGSLAEMRPGMSFRGHGRQEPDAPGRQGPRDRGGEDEPRAGLRTANEAQGEVLFCFWLLSLVLDRWRRCVPA
jgi:hypothetical protein